MIVDVMITSCHRSPPKNKSPFSVITYCWLGAFGVVGFTLVASLLFVRRFPPF